MGLAASVLAPSCLVGTGLCLLNGNVPMLLGCFLPFACELAHVITDEALMSEGKLSIDDKIADVAHWNIVQFGIRSYSLNCCGRWNPFLDTLRLILAPCAASFSGRMIHDVVVAFICDQESGSEALLLLCRAHNGDLDISLCQTVEEVDIKGKPEIFGIPKRGWWKAQTDSPVMRVGDLVQKCLGIPAKYQPVSNNCHHFAKELWNWHAEKLSEEGSTIRRMRLPRSRRCPSRDSTKSFIFKRKPFENSITIAHSLH